MGGKGAVRRAWTYNLRMVKYSVVAARCAEQCEKKKRTREEEELRARPASSGKAHQPTRVAPYPAGTGRQKRKQPRSTRI